MRARFAILLLPLGACASAPSIELTSDDAGSLTVSIDGREAFTYRGAARFAIPHVHPLRSPSGRSLLVQQTEPFPHHRALWIADRVQLEGGRDVDFYHCTKNLRDRQKPELGHSSFIRHDAFDDQRIAARDATFAVRSTWIADEDTPILDDRRRFHVRDLGDGEYLIDLTWELRAAHGDVTFRSDAVHYAWPYLRIEPGLSVASGGVLVDDRGRRGQAETHGKVARWIDYSHTLDGVAEGVAVFVFPDGEEHTWLTRDYGTFGPRRAADFSGTRFALKKGEAIAGRVGILVHRGDADGGRVAERYREYAAGE